MKPDELEKAAASTATANTQHLKWPYHGPPQTSPHTHSRLRRVRYATPRVADPTRLLTLTIRDLFANVESAAPPARTVKVLEGNSSLP